MRALPRLSALTAVAVVSLASGSAASRPEARPAAGIRHLFQAPADSVKPHEFYFTRGISSSYYGCGPGDQLGQRGYRRCSWSTDYPKADQQFLFGVRRLVDIDAYEMDHAVSIVDPKLNRFPFLYMLEVGAMSLTPAEQVALRRYSDAGGFIVIDDFWGSSGWANFEHEIEQVFPDFQIVDLPMDHPLFNMVYPIKEIIQVPNVGNAKRGQTYEQDGYVAYCRGMIDKEGRLRVVINWNTDLGDAWEWAEDPYYPLKYSTFAWEMGINFIIYAMSH